YMSLKLVICIVWLPFHSPATRMEKARFHELGPRAGFSSAPEFHRNERWPCVFCLVFPSCFCPSYWPTGGEMRRVSGLAALGALALSFCCWIFLAGLFWSSTRDTLTQICARVDYVKHLKEQASEEVQAEFKALV